MNRSRGCGWGVAAALLAGALGCGPSAPPAAARKLTIGAEEVPASVMDVAKKQLADCADFEHFRKTEADGKTTKGFEIRARVKATGKLREVMVAPDGKILEREGFE